MSKNRLEAFSDGVLAIIITIMVLELKAPRGADFAALRPLLPLFLSYALSFVYLGIYWNNHHHMFHAAQRVNGAVLWANLHLLFWLSLVPFVTAWMGQNHFAPAPLALYGFVLLMAALAYTLLQSRLIALGGSDSLLAAAVGADTKGKVSLLLYVLGIPLSFVSSWIAGALYIAVAVIWLAPDRRIERVLDHPNQEPGGIAETDGMPEREPADRAKDTRSRQDSPPCSQLRHNDETARAPVADRDEGITAQ